MGLSRLADESGLPIPTIHRLLRTLGGLGHLRGNGEPTYLLAPRLTRLGESFGAMLNVGANPHLERRVHELGESANLAMLDGHEIVHVARAPTCRASMAFT